MGIKPFKHWNEDSSDDRSLCARILNKGDNHEDDRSLGSRILHKDDCDEDDD